MQQGGVILYQLSGQPIGPSFKGQEIQKTEHSIKEVNCHNLLFREFQFSKGALFQFSRKEASNLVDQIE